MSYDVGFYNSNGDICKIAGMVPIGGTYCLGSDEAYLNITFNYSWIFRNHGLTLVHHEDIKDVQVLDGKTAEECIKILNEVISSFGDVSRSDNYWEETDGNAKSALIDLKYIAEKVPKKSICKVEC